MYTNNYINNSGTTIVVQNGGIPSLTSDPSDFTDPNTPNVWLNITEGVMKMWDGNEIKIFDFNEGNQVSLFGTPLGDI